MTNRKTEVRREPCSKCEGLKSDTFALYDDGSGWCFRCGYWTPAVIGPTKRNPKIYAVTDSHEALCARLWDEAGPIAPGSPPDIYLRGRGLEPVAALRHRPPAKPWEPWKHGDRNHCMLARYTDAHGIAKGLHRTFLTPEGVRIERRMLGDTSRCAIRLAQVGSSRMLQICEGVEDALAAMIEWPNLGAAWAAGSAGHMQRMEIPKSITAVVIRPDSDDVGLAAGCRLQARLRDSGVASFLHLPTFGDPAEDLIR